MNVATCKRKKHDALWEIQFSKSIINLHKLLFYKKITIIGNAMPARM